MFFGFRVAASLVGSQSSHCLPLYPKIATMTACEADCSGQLARFLMPAREPLGVAPLRLTLAPLDTFQGLGREWTHLYQEAVMPLR